MKAARRFLLVAPLVALVLVGASSEVWPQQTEENRSSDALAAQQKVEIPVCTAPGVQTAPVSTISVNGNSQDGVIVAWLNTVDDSYYAQKLDMLGRPLWGPCGFRFAGTLELNSPSAEPQIVSTSNGDALFIYLKDVGQFRHVFATVIHYEPHAEAPLPVQLSTIPDGMGIRIAPSGTNFIVTWTAYSNIYAQKVNRFAQKLWGADEIVVCDEGNNQVNPEILPDSQGGVFITFLDDRSPSDGLDVWAQRLDENGSALWAYCGVPIHLQYRSDYEEQEKPEGGGGQRLMPPHYTHKMVPSVNGGFIIAHPDLVNYTASQVILAQGVSSDGDVLWTRVVGPHYSVEINPLIISDGNSGASIVWEQLLSPYDNYHIFASRIDRYGNSIWSGRRISEFTSTAYGKYLPSTAIPNGIVLQASTGYLVIPWLTANNTNPVLNANLVTQSNGCSLLNPPFAVSTGAIPARPMASVNVLGPTRLIVYEKAGDIFARFIPSPAFPGVSCPDK